MSDLPSPQPISEAFVDACAELGLPRRRDFNGGEQAGAGLYQTTSRNGWRSSAAGAYLRPARARANLTVETGAHVTRVLIDKGRAVGVAYVKGDARDGRARPTGAERTLHAGREVILAAGAIGSPKLLMLSGLGPAAHLSDLGIGVVADLPGVGENLQDHYAVDIAAALAAPEGLDIYRKPGPMLRAALAYGLHRRGPITSNVCEAGGFWYSDPPVPPGAARRISSSISWPRRGRRGGSGPCPRARGLPSTPIPTARKAGGGCGLPRRRWARGP